MTMTLTTMTMMIVVMIILATEREKGRSVCANMFLFNLRSVTMSPTATQRHPAAPPPKTASTAPARYSRLVVILTKLYFFHLSC